jgi:hypothetical protein
MEQGISTSASCMGRVAVSCGGGLEAVLARLPEVARFGAGGSGGGDWGATVVRLHQPRIEFVTTWRMSPSNTSAPAARASSRELPAAFTGALAAAFALCNTMFWAVPLYSVALLRIVAPTRALRSRCDAALTWIAEHWVASNSAALKVLHSTQWQVRGLETLRPNASYLVSSNHLSWTDIVVLQRVFQGHIPFVRFFIKQELFWVPVLGLAWWALHFPFMKRYSDATLSRRPELRGKDLETTRRVCERLRGTRITILNFLEGTRCTPEKQHEQESHNNTFYGRNPGAWPSYCARSVISSSRCWT